MINYLKKQMQSEQGACNTLSTMAIQIQDYGMQNVGTRLGVDMSKEAIYEYARGAAAEMKGLLDIGLGLEQMAMKIEDVKAVGDVSSTRGGLDKMNTDIWRDIDADGQVEGLTERWNDEVNFRLSDYIPENISQKARPVVDQLISEAKRQGLIEAERRMNLSKLHESRKSWASELDRSKNNGNVNEAKSLVEVGSGIFLNKKEVDQQNKELQQNMEWAPWKKAIEEKPLELLELLNNNDKSLPSDPALRNELKQQVSQRLHDLQGVYGDMLLKNRKTLGDIPMQGLDVAEKLGFVSSSQRIRYEEASRLASQHKKKQLPPPKLDPVFACHLRVQMDEMEDDPFSKGLVAVELATSGADTQEFERISSRFDQMKSVPKFVRQGFSKEIQELYRGGYLGSLKDPATFKRWSQLQDSVMSQLQDDSDASISAATQILAYEKQKYTSWVTSSNMKNNLNQQPKQNIK